MTDLWLPLALGATVTWGLGQIVAKRGVGALGPRRMVALVALGEAVVFAGVALALPTSFPGPLPQALFGLGAGLAGILGYVAYYEAIARGTVARIGTITAAYPAGTVLLALLLLQEVLTGPQFLGIGLLLGSAVLLGHAEHRKRESASPPVTLLVVLAFVLWAAWGFLVKVSVEVLGEGATLSYFAATNAGTAVLLLARPRALPAPTGRRRWRWPLGAIALGGGGVILMTLAFARGPAALVAPVTGAYPVVTVLAAIALLRERLRRAEALAFLAFAAGLFAVAWG